MRRLKDEMLGFWEGKPALGVIKVGLLLLVRVFRAEALVVAFLYACPNFERKLFGPSERDVETKVRGLRHELGRLFPFLGFCAVTFC